MTRYKPSKNKDYVELATKIGLAKTIEELKIDIVMRNRHFYLRACARRLQCDPATLFRFAKTHGIKFPKWSDIISWNDMHEVNKK
jgi:hypothetical protein